MKVSCKRDGVVVGYSDCCNGCDVLLDCALARQEDMILEILRINVMLLRLNAERRLL